MSERQRIEGKTAKDLDSEGSSTVTGAEEGDEGGLRKRENLVAEYSGGPGPPCRSWLRRRRRRRLGFRRRDSVWLPEVEEARRVAIRAVVLSYVGLGRGPLLAEATCQTLVGPTAEPMRITIEHFLPTYCDFSRYSTTIPYSTLHFNDIGTTQRLQPIRTLHIKERWGMV